MSRMFFLRFCSRCSDIQPSHPAASAPFCMRKIVRLSVAAIDAFFFFCSPPWCDSSQNSN